MTRRHMLDEAIFLVMPHSVAHAFCPVYSYDTDFSTECGTGFSGTGETKQSTEQHVVVSIESVLKLLDQILEFVPRPNP